MNVKKEFIDAMENVMELQEETKGTHYRNA